jgi:D-lactate dehydrogenase (cytochrome)
MKALLISAFAAGLGYGYASYGQELAQASKKPQYGSTKDFAKVSPSITHCE